MFIYFLANIPMTEMEKFISKYSLGVAGFLSSFFAILIDGEFQDSIVVLLWFVHYRYAFSFIIIIVCILISFEGSFSARFVRSRPQFLTSAQS
jgi:hypothetical protein